jgi:2-polyprenyl-3-methyl-5-hydroxy-6-metoxy-1,4-benzoquinol methylase
MRRLPYLRRLAGCAPIGLCSGAGRSPPRGETAITCQVPNEGGRHATHPYVLNERRDVYDVMPKSITTLLDVGCSRGGFCQLVKLNHPTVTVWGIEADPEAAAEAKPRPDRVIVGSFPEDVPADAPRFDAILFSDVLEHMEDPWAALGAARKFLSPDGVVMASIPNIRHWSGIRSILIRGDFTYTDTGLFDRTHLRFFTRSTMLAMFAGAGYRAERIVPTGISERLAARAVRWRRMLPRVGEEISTLRHINPCATRRCACRIRRHLVRSLGGAAKPEMPVRGHRAASSGAPRTGHVREV